MDRLKNTLKSKKNVLGVIFLIIGVLLAISAVFYHFNNKRLDYYAQKLSELQMQVDDIDKLIQDDVSNLDTKSLIDKYSSKMDELRDTCNAINAYKSDNSDQKYIDKVASAQRLCNDLNPVATYAKQLYQFTESYLLMNPSLGNLEESITITQNTQNNLKNLNYPTVNDPAIGEISTLIKRTEDELIAIKKDTASSNADKQTQMDKVVESHNTSRDNILKARIYYWKNTINIEALKKSIANLKTDFESGN